AYESNVPSIRRPARHAVAVRAGREIAHLLPSEIINCDEAVIAPCADQRNLAAIGRPFWIRIVAAKIGELMGGRGPGNRRNPQLLARRPHRKLSVRGEFDIFAVLFRAAHLTQQTWSAGVHVDRPHLLLAGPDTIRGIGYAPMLIGLAAAHVHQGAPIRRDAQPRNRQTVIAVVVRNLPGSEVGRVRHPEVANAFRVKYPSYSGAVRSRHQACWKG